MSPIVTAISSPPGFARSWATIAARKVDPRDRYASVRQGQGDPAGADRELERPSFAGELGEKIDRSPDHGRATESRPDRGRSALQPRR